MMAVSKSTVESYLARSGIGAIVSEAVSAVVSTHAAQAGTQATPDPTRALAREFTAMAAASGIDEVRARAYLDGRRSGVQVYVTSFCGSTSASVDMPTAGTSASAHVSGTATPATARPVTAAATAMSSQPRATSCVSSETLKEWSDSCSQALRGVDPCDQLRADDAIMCVSIPAGAPGEDLPAVLRALRLATSMAVARLGALHARRPLFGHIAAIRAGRSIPPRRGRGRAEVAEGKDAVEDRISDAFARLSVSLPRVGFNIVSGGDLAMHGSILLPGAWLPTRRHFVILEPMPSRDSSQTSSIAPVQRCLLHGMRTLAAFASILLAKGTAGIEAADGSMLVPSGAVAGRAPTIDDVLRMIIEAQHSAVLAASGADTVTASTPAELAASGSATARGGSKQPPSAASGAKPPQAMEAPPASPRMLATTASAAAASSLGLSLGLGLDIGADFLHVPAEELERERREAEAAAAAAAAQAATVSGKGKPASKAAPAGAKAGAAPAATKAASIKGKDAGAAASPAPAWAADPVSGIDLKGASEEGLEVYDWNSARSRATLLSAAAASMSSSPEGEVSVGRVPLSSLRLQSLLAELLGAHPGTQILLDPFAASDWQAWKAAMQAFAAPAITDEPHSLQASRRVELVSSQMSAMTAGTIDRIFSRDPASLMAELDSRSGDGASVTHSASAAALLVSAARRHAAVVDDVYKSHVSDWAMCAATAVIDLQLLPTVSAAALVSRYAANAGMNLAVSRSTRVRAIDSFEADLTLGLDATLLLLGGAQDQAAACMIDRLHELAQ